MTSTVQIISHSQHCLIQAWDVKGPDKRVLITECVVEPGDVETANIWSGRELVICEIRADHPLVTGVKPPPQPESEAA